jgi:hypothetical protein
MSGVMTPAQELTPSHAGLVMSSLCMSANNSREFAPDQVGTPSNAFYRMPGNKKRCSEKGRAESREIGFE